MAMVNRVACFLTCGYTEAGAMQAFLRKINANFEYKQYLPNKTIKKKGMPKSISPEVNGLTGESLLNKVYEIMKKHTDEISQCSAIVIEDDLDGRFEGWNDEKIKKYYEDVCRNVRDILGDEVKVFIVYASPEVEGWFLADWENSFESVYAEVVDDVETDARQYFLHHLRQYVVKFVLREYAGDIERYGYLDGKYVKLSDEIIRALESDVKEYVRNLPNANERYVNQIEESRQLYYSKRLHGDKMLRRIEPSTVAAVCKHFFAPAYYKLSALV
jgi:hypothetical protein